MARPAFDSHDCISALNTLKQSFIFKGKPFTKDQLMEGLSNCGLPKSMVFWMAFRNSGLIANVDRTHYAFVNNNPIYVGVLESIKNKYLELNRKYSAPKEKKVEETVEEVAIVAQIDPIKEAIKLLKDNGYIIYAPKIEYVRIQLFFK